MSSTSTVLSERALEVEKRIRLAALNEAVAAVAESPSAITFDAAERALARLRAAHDAEVWSNTGSEREYQLVDRC